MWFLSRKSKQKDTNDTELALDMSNIPKHIAIIMDGNGRWAKQRNLPRSLGHKAGVEAIRNIVKECNRLGVKYLTLYAFSTENWKRPLEEVSTLMKLLVDYLKNEIEELNSNGVIINHLGDISKLPEICQQELKKAYDHTKTNKGLMMNLAINYGGRDELINAIKNISGDVASGVISSNDITETMISRYLYTSGIPDPDLIIRPSGEYRISNFLLWQCAYSEFWYSNINWPDFTIGNLHCAILDYQKRDRRFGGIK
jgi:undecaprenyl diphosphate synthase